VIESSKSVEMYMDGFIKDRALEGVDLTKTRNMKKHFNPVYMALIFELLGQIGVNSEDTFKASF